MHGNDDPDSEEAGPYEIGKAIPPTSKSVEAVSFENFAMFLNLINNVYINSKPSKSTNEVIEEEEETNTQIFRPYGYVDAQGRFNASSQAEVDKIYHKFYPLMVNRRKNQQIKTRTARASARQPKRVEINLADDRKLKPGTVTNKAKNADTLLTDRSMGKKI